ncbi:MAG: DEAD/DEAH box helicase [Bacteroidales bacterium]|nr:DEAD/DEAH box helicase [Bacteroidales bacterium]
MKSQAIEFYKKSSENEKEVIKAICFSSPFITPGNVQDYLNKVKTLNKKVSPQKLYPLIHDTIALCLKNDILYRKDFGHYPLVQLSFFMYIIPELKPFMPFYSDFTRKSYYFYRDDSTTVSYDFLIYLYFDANNLEGFQNYLDNKKIVLNYSELQEIFDYDYFYPNLKFLNFISLHQLFLNHLFKMILNNKTKKDILLFHDKLKLFLPENNEIELIVNQYLSDYYADLNDTNSQVSDREDFIGYFKRASRELALGNANESLKLFTKGIDLQRKFYDNIYVPFTYTNTFFYLFNLLIADKEQSNPLIYKLLSKKDSAGNKWFFREVTEKHLKNTGQVNEEVRDKLEFLLKNTDKNDALFYMIIMYLLDLKPRKVSIDRYIHILKNAYNSGLITISYEVAFLLDRWFNTHETNTLLNDYQQKFVYKPVLSQIVKLEEWEKDLNLIESFLPRNAKNKQTSQFRVIYKFYPNSMSLIPKGQTLQASGAWSSGRNIAESSFQSHKTKGMTAQDIRIASCLNNDYYSYGSNFDFDERVWVEVAGHPYVFLEDSKNILVEFVLSEPIFGIEKMKSNYYLTCDVKEAEKGIVVQKETNTRYKIYNLTAIQKSLIQTINKKTISVPETGKEKLLKLIGSLSQHVRFQSDEVSIMDEQPVKEVAPETKLRMQILPFGDGLKAELFAKPFGSIPPYFQPGVGGKMLFETVEGERLKVIRDLKSEKLMANQLYNAIQKLDSVDMSSDLISFSEPKDSLNLLELLHDFKEICQVEWPEGERFRIKKKLNLTHINLNIKQKIDWFAIDGEIQIDDDQMVSLSYLMKQFSKRHGRFIALEDGEFLALTDELRKYLSELESYTITDSDELKINKFSSTALFDFLDDVKGFKGDKSWKDFRKKIENGMRQNYPIPRNLEAELRPYQEEGFRWMSRLSSWEAGACLADDMGLGKTIQTLAVLLNRISKGIALVVCPVSVVSNWQTEARRFAPSLQMKTLGVSARKETVEGLENGDVLVISYGILQSEIELIKSRDYATVVLDEAHIIKNYATKTSKAAMQLKAGFRIALTGTPIQNHLMEIWNIFQFLNPGLLGSKEQFQNHYIKSESDEARKSLKKLITPFILRRTKSVVLEELPSRTEILKTVELSDGEKAFYELQRQQALMNIQQAADEGKTSIVQTLAEITKLRLASCHPALVNEDIPLESSKLNTFIDLVDELLENKHKALVFSQFVKHLSLVRKALDEKKINYLYLDGSTPADTRQKLVKSFQSGNYDLFLISLKAGGLGLNLTAADYVIHLDPWWNPAIEDQASDRAHRIGQTRPVTIYRLVASGTIEEKIIELHRTKRDLADKLLEGSDQAAKLSVDEMLELLKG